MVRIGKISVFDTKRVMGYAVKHRKGRLYDIESYDAKYGKTVQQFCEKGYIETDYAAESQTWRITEQGDRYYKHMFGSFHYYEKRLAGIFSFIFG